MEFLLIFLGTLLLIIIWVAISNIETIKAEIHSFLYPEKTERFKIHQRLIQEGLESKEVEKREEEEKIKRAEKRKHEEEEKIKRAEKLKYEEEKIKRQKQIEREKYINELEKYKRELTRKIFIIEKYPSDSNVRMVNGIPVDSWEDLSIFELAFAIRNNSNSYSEDKLEQEYKKYRSGMYSYDLGCALNNFDILFIKIGDETYPDSLIVNSTYFYGAENDTIKELINSLQESDRLSKELDKEIEARENYYENLHRERTLNGYYNEYDD